MSRATASVLTTVPGSPFAAGGGPISAAVEPTGKFAYIANFDSNEVSAFSIGSNGALTTVPGSPFATRVRPVSVAITRLLHSTHDETENATR
jgi:DNA-binding beta-propeller fold protein YncE